MNQKSSLREDLKFVSWMLTGNMTLTEFPEGDDQLMRMLESAIRLGEKQSTRLAEIHLPTGRMTATGSSFRDIPVEDGGDVLRLVFGH
jgi:hypothetical protein